MKTINVNSPKYGLFQTMIDDDTYLWAKDFSWCIHKEHSGFYVVYNQRMSNGKQKMTYLHQAILGQPLNKKMVDHIDGDRLNNQKSNLRIIDSSGNCRNRIVHRNGAIPGVHYHKGIRKWVARTVGQIPRISLGVFDTKEAAIKAVLGEVE